MNETDMYVFKEIYFLRNLFINGHHPPLTTLTHHPPPTTHRLPPTSCHFIHRSHQTVNILLREVLYIEGTKGTIVRGFRGV